MRGTRLKKITVAKQVNQERRGSEKYSRVFLEDVNDYAVFVLDPKGKFVSWNIGAQNLTGYTEQEILGRHLSSLYLPKAIEQHKPEQDLKLAAGQGYFEGDGEWLHKDGSLLWVRMITTILLNESGRLRGFSGVACDITHRKLVEIERARLETAARESAFEWRLTFDAIEFPLLVADLTGHVTQLNNAAQELSGKSVEEITGQAISNLGTDEPWRKAAELVRLVQETRCAISCQTQDGLKGRTWDISANWVHCPEANTERIIIMARDITREQQLQTSLRRSETMAAMGSLVAGVAHEVRNPLFAISSVLDAFEARLGQHAEYQRFRSVLRGELDRLNHFMQELLEYGTPPCEQLCEGLIEDVITQAVRWSTPLAERLKVKITHNLKTRYAPVLMDRRRLPQVFLNLLENAIFFSPPGGIVTLEARRVRQEDRGWIECAIKDGGPGFHPEDLPRIFEPFFSRRRGGTGLGLSIAHRIVEGHGGRIIADNHPEGGAVVTVSFPSGETQLGKGEGTSSGPK